MSRDGPSGGTPLAVVGPLGELKGPTEWTDTTSTEVEQLPSGWEERRTENGRPYYVNHVTRSTQWIRPRIVNKIRTQGNKNGHVLVNGNSNNLANGNCNAEITRMQEFCNNNNNNDVDELQSPVTSPGSSTTTVSPVISPQKEQIVPLRPAPSIPTAAQTDLSVQRVNLGPSSPTSSAVVPAPNNISCNVPVSSNNDQHQQAAPQSIVSTPQRPQRERRQRSNEDRRNDGSSRRRAQRNRNSVAGGPPQVTGAQGTGQASSSQSAKLDLPPGYG